MQIVSTQENHSSSAASHISINLQVKGRIGRKDAVLGGELLQLL
jgi:hypothetical protein